MDDFTLLSRVSDTLGVPLAVARDRTLAGGGSAVYTPLHGLLAPFKIRPLRMFSSHHKDGSGGMLFSTIGNLLILVGVNPKTTVISLYLVDKSKLAVQPAESLLGTAFDLAMAYKALADGVVKSFVWKDNKWTPFVYIPK